MARTTKILGAVRKGKRKETFGGIASEKNKAKGKLLLATHGWKMVRCTVVCICCSGFLWACMHRKYIGPVSMGRMELLDRISDGTRTHHDSDEPINAPKWASA